MVFERDGKKRRISTFGELLAGRKGIRLCADR